MTDRNDTATGLTKKQIIDGLHAIGLKQGDVVLIHTAMRTFGHIDGGAATAMDAFLEVLGPRGTLVAPTFTFCHEAEDDPIIDPLQDPSSEMGHSNHRSRAPTSSSVSQYRVSAQLCGDRAAGSSDHRSGPGAVVVRPAFQFRCYAGARRAGRALRHDLPKLHEPSFRGNGL